MDILQPIASIVGVASGISGLVLGIVNCMHQRDSTRPRLRVRPKVLTLVDRDNKSIEKNVGVVEVANVGHMPVIGSNIGFRPKRKGERGHIIVSPPPINDGNWPGEIAPGSVVLLRIKLNTLPRPEDLGRAFAKTMVDDIFLCSRRDMKQFRNDLARSRDADSAMPPATRVLGIRTGFAMRQATSVNRE